ncbi:MAG TPA: hypothetical protein VGU73_06590 [Acidimicrobiia bacterium]|nr:hypothetical protein [Acidimicrobiia bacterium]
MTQSQPSEGIEISATFFFLAFILYFFPPTFVVDGQAMKGAWNSPTMVPVPAGSHSVKVFFRYLWIMDAGPGELQVDVPAGGVRRVSYRAPWLVFLNGKISAS